MFDVCAGGVLFQAAQIAADSWNINLAGRVKIELRQAKCSNSARFRNGSSEISYGKPDSKIHRAVGLYMGLLDRTGQRIAEEDILIHEKISDLTFLSNILTHEFGHALGLNHAVGATCREAVMAEFACDVFRTPPTSADIDAARRIYSLKDSSLSQFDLDGNGTIDDDEFFDGLEQWINNHLSNRQFFDLIDAWISSQEIPQAEGSSTDLLGANLIRLYDLSGRFIGMYTGHQLINEMRDLPRETYIFQARFSGKWLLGMIRLR